MLEHLLSTYGYLALFIGTFLEGETILIIAGVAASEGLLDIQWAILSAFAGSLLGDQLLFFIARYHGDWLLSRLPS
ncbi:MAG: DedA family protein, partial [Candidatus Sumerlaeota bacterium]|nr:DedA family protein [Candidatus Sumerlaeota bacterium]